MRPCPCSAFVRGLVLATTVSLMLAPAAAGQTDTACTWDRCALRVHGGFIGSRLVRGIDGEKVASLAFFPPTLPLFAERSEIAAAHYATFQSRASTGSVLAIVGIAATIAGLTLINDDETASAVLVLGGAAVSFAGGIVAMSGHNDLSRAVWWYNRTLATDEPPSRP